MSYCQRNLSTVYHQQIVTKPWFLLQLKSHYSRSAKTECDELKMGNAVSFQIAQTWVGKNWLRLPLNPQQVGPLEVMKTKRRVLMRNIKSSGLCNKHDWFEAGNPLEQKCGTISTVVILFVLIFCNDKICDHHKCKRWTFLLQPSGGKYWSSRSSKLCRVHYEHVLTGQGNQRIIHINYA